MKIDNKFRQLACLLAACSLSTVLASNVEARDVVYIERNGLIEPMEMGKPAQVAAIDLSKRAANASAPFNNATAGAATKPKSPAVNLPANVNTGSSTSFQDLADSAHALLGNSSIKASASPSPAKESSSTTTHISSSKKHENGTQEARTRTSSSHTSSLVRAAETGNLLATGNARATVAASKAPFSNSTSASTSKKTSSQKPKGTGNVRNGESPEPLATAPFRNSTSPASSAIRGQFGTAAQAQSAFPGLESVAASSRLTESSTTTSTHKTTRTVTRTPSVVTRTESVDTHIYSTTVVVQKTATVVPVAASHLSALGIAVPAAAPSSASIARAPEIMEAPSASAVSSLPPMPPPLVPVAPAASPNVADHQPTPAASPAPAAAPANAAGQQPVVAASAAAQRGPDPAAIVPMASAPAAQASAPAQAPAQAPPAAVPAPQDQQPAVAPPISPAPLTFHATATEAVKGTVTIAAGNNGNSFVGVASAVTAPTPVVDSCNCACRCPAGMFPMPNLANNVGAMAAKPSQGFSVPQGLNNTRLQGHQNDRNGTRSALRTLATSAIRPLSSNAAVSSFMASLSSLSSSFSSSASVATVNSDNVPKVTQASSKVRFSSFALPSASSLTTPMAAAATSIDRMATDDVVSTVFAASLTSKTASHLTVGGSVVPLSSAVSEPLIVNGRWLNLPSQEGLQN